MNTGLRRWMPVQLDPRLPVVAARFISGLGVDDEFLADSTGGVSYARCAARALRNRREELIPQTIVQREAVGDLPRVLKPASALIAIDSRRPDVFAVGEVW